MVEDLNTSVRKRGRLSHWPVAFAVMAREFGMPSAGHWDCMQGVLRTSYYRQRRAIFLLPDQLPFHLFLDSSTFDSHHSPFLLLVTRPGLVVDRRERLHPTAGDMHVELVRLALEHAG